MKSKGFLFTVHFDCEMQRAKGTAAARKHTSETLKAFFSDPENRRKRSIAMKGLDSISCMFLWKPQILCISFVCLYYWPFSSYDAGVKFYCGHCGREGHRKHYCPELKDSLIDRRFRCRLCGEKGHNRRTCRKSETSNHNKGTITKQHRCKICHQSGHNRRTCPKLTGSKLDGSDAKKDFHTPAIFVKKKDTTWGHVRIEIESLQVLILGTERTPTTFMSTNVSSLNLQAV